MRQIFRVTGALKPCFEFPRLFMIGDKGMEKTHSSFWCRSVKFFKNQGVHRVYAVDYADW